MSDIATKNNNLKQDENEGNLTGGHRRFNRYVKKQAPGGTQTNTAATKTKFEGQCH
jgi:hypothetical protein